MLTVHGSTKFLILGFMFLKISFLCSFFIRSFVVQIFSFSRTVCSWLRSLDEFIVVPITNYNGLAIVSEADLCCGDFLSEKLSSQFGSFHYFLVSATECFFSFDNQKIQRQFFFVC